MKLFVAGICLIAVAAAAPAFHEGIKLPAIKHQDDRDDLGQFTIHYITVDGTERKESGRLVPTADGNAKVLIVDGEVSYVGDDGKKYTIQYTAGTGGYTAVGDHLPVAPEVPQVPDVPQVPQVPQVPDVPQVPEVPQVSEVPQVPEIPKVPEVQ